VLNIGAWMDLGCYAMVGNYHATAPFSAIHIRTGCGTVKVRAGLAWWLVQGIGRV
jgi:hypothetical protein